MDYIGLDAILYNDGIAQAQQNGLVYTVRETSDDDDHEYSCTLFIARGAEPPYQTTSFECSDDILMMYPGLKWEAVEMEG